jgi:predicted enzyme related to lactoylglutathione lyase
MNTTSRAVLKLSVEVITLPVSDIERALRFYVDQVGFTLAPTRFSWTCWATTRATSRSTRRSKITSGLTSHVSSRSGERTIPFSCRAVLRRSGAIFPMP